MTQPNPGSRIARIARIGIEFFPAYLVSLVILPFVIAGGRLRPWLPQTTDLQVYVVAVRSMLAGDNIMTVTSAWWHLYFIYPPFSAILMLPLAVGPYLFSQLVWTAGLVAAQNIVLRRCGLPRGWPLALVSVAIVIGMEPIRTTLGYGQLNTFLMLLVIIDLLPDRAGASRRLPHGILIGLAAAIKLTPALFVLMLLILGRRRAAFTAIGTFVILTGIATLVQPAATWTYVLSLIHGKTHTSGPLYVGNQSMLGVVLRFFGETPGNTVVGMVIGLIFGALAAFVGAYWWRQGSRVLAIGLVGLGSTLASPLSWTHHFVWILPVGIAAIYQISRRQWADNRDHAPLPRWLTASAGVVTVWVSVCLPLALLPYARGAENSYNAWQEFVANFGPLLAAAMLVVSAALMILRRRDPGPPTTLTCAQPE